MLIDSSLQGLQSADIIRERFRLEPKPMESSQKKKRNNNNQEMLTDDASSSPPMSLTGIYLECYFSKFINEK